MISFCSNCGLPITGKPSYFERVKQPSCSKACHIAICQKRMTGKNNHQYGKKGHLNASFKQGLTRQRNNNQIDYWVYQPDHPFANINGRVKYHRFVVEQNNLSFNPDVFIWLNNKPYLKPELVVHHIDGDHDNNDISNLQVVTKSEHRKIHNKTTPRNRNTRTGRFVKGNDIKFKLLSKNAKKPFQATTGSAGYDLFAAKIEDRGDAVVYYTDIATEIPEGFAGLLLPRSSIVKTGMHLGNSVGLLDRDFRGNISFVFYKREGCQPYNIGDRIGQLLIMPVPEVRYIEADELTETERGAGGYGSTGK